MAKFQKLIKKKSKAELVEASSSQPVDMKAEEKMSMPLPGSRAFTVSAATERSTKHQFDDTGIKYERKSNHGRLVFVIILILALIGLAIFVSTPQGQSLILKVTNQTSSDSAVSETSSSSSVSTGADNSLPTIPARDFSESDQASLREQLTIDSQSLNVILSNPTGFDAPDWNLELGI